MNKVAVIIVNYNMVERADALANHIENSTIWPHDIIVVDNGSDLVEQSRYTALKLKTNVQTCNGWLMGLHYCDALEQMNKDKYFAYWFIITSAEFVKGGDPLKPMVELLLRDSDAVGVHPALTQDSTTMWVHMKDEGAGKPRETHMIDNIASLYRADWFNNMKRFDPALIYAHGIDLETCWKARKHGKTLWIDERVKVKKVTNIGYDMNRMNMSAQQRAMGAQMNMDEVLIPRYGIDYWEKLLNE